MIQDLKHGVRSLRRTPGFTISAIATLAIALGATIAIFTVVNATMLTPPPYPQPDALLVFAPREGGSATPREFEFLRARSRSFAAIGAQQSIPGWNLVAGTHAEYVEGLEVSDGYFEVHAVPLLLGRAIASAEAQPRGRRTVVLSEALWRRVFNAQADVLGRIVDLGGRPHEIVGVASSEFRSFPAAQVWTPLQASPQSNGRNLRVTGRLREGITPVQAAAELDTMRDELRTLLTNEQARADQLAWTPLERWFSARSRELMIVLLAAVGALLLVAAVNVGGLQISRGLARAREFASRAALGATRARLFREAFAESLLLAAAASSLGLALAVAGTRALLALLPPDLSVQLLSGRPVVIDARVVSVAILLGAGCAVVFGLAPAIASAHVDLRAAVGDVARITNTRRTVLLRRGFAVGQLALALVLLIGAGLLIRTFGTLRSAELGFDPEGIVVGEMAVQGEPQDVVERTVFIERSLEGILQLAAVTDAAVASAVPVDQPVNLSVQAQGAALLPEPRAVDWMYATPRYFDLFDIPLRTGRLFDARDGQASAPVAVVNVAFANAFFGRDNVIGETLQTRGVAEPIRQIVGVVGDVRARSGSSFARSFFALAGPPSPMVYVPMAQVSEAAFRSVHQFTPMRWVMKTPGGIAGVPEGVREIVRRGDARKPFRRFLAMEQIIGRDIGVHRFLATLLTLFAAIAMTLAAVGLYALIAQLVAHRRREIGIRIALGATRARVLRIFVSESARLTAAGLAIGLLAAPLLTRAMTMFLVGVTPLDTATFVFMPALFVSIAVAATMLPARRAARLDPAASLRAE